MYFKNRGTGYVFLLKYMTRPPIGEIFMGNFSKEELEEALRAIASTISKCEKVLPKLKQGTAQHTLLVRRIKAFQVAWSLIMQALGNKDEQQ